MNIEGQRDRQRLARGDLFTEKLIAGLLVLLFKQGAGAAGVTDHLTVLKNLPCVVVGNVRVFNLAGVERKQDAKAVQPQV
ncbi:hypothetical protein SDC9_154065 [bioreactor metagenome]|uniref:Uncharacterized protein n=1 Tax=bioreactor metagenome TaxID=1076179 RepID=A0A645EXN0_9ZZZZ